MHFVPRMHDLIIDTILSSKKQFMSIFRENSFELFGFDFLIDEDFRTWLIECNTNPYLGVPNKFIENLMPKMINDMLKLVVDPLFPPENEPKDKNNDFELLYCTHLSKLSAKPVNRRRDIKEKNLYPIKQFM